MTTQANQDCAATERYARRARERAQQRTAFGAAPGALVGDDLERMHNRRALLSPNDGIGFERILGKSDLVGINFLEIGLQAARPVCRIQVRDIAGCILGYGTGFMVSPNLLLTNNHVLESAELAQRSLADFNFEDDAAFVPKPTKTFPLDPARFFFTDSELDFTLVAVRPAATDGTTLAAFGELRLYEESGKALLGEYLSIMQHPSGMAKQAALRENRLIDVVDTFLHYSTDTLPGASGSPVFNDQWQVVALHHAGVKKLDDAGHVLAQDGQIWHPEQGEDAIAWVANEGVRISCICARLRAESAAWTSDQRALVEQIFATPPAAPAEMRVSALDLAWYKAQSGYDPTFLGPRIDLPQLPAQRLDDRAPLNDNAGYELKYPHFSIVMSKSRRLAYFTAVNIDGSQMRALPRRQDRWYFDPRLETKYQCGPELYRCNDLDLGHLVRRLDPDWGAEAAQADEATFHFTNCSPQHKNLNQRTWLNLEDYILRNAERYSLKVTVITGPVFRADDLIYRGQYQIPAEFWKVAVMVKDDGQLSATAYLQTQKNLIEDLEFAYGQYRTYQVPITTIEALTELDFGELRNHDALANIEGTAGRVVCSCEDLRL